MSEESTPTRPYGTWPSPVSAAQVASAGVGIEHVAVADGTAYWRETRPDEGGRGVVVREGDEAPVDVTPEGYDVRTLVHEYGGGDFTVADGTVYFARFDDQRLYRQPPDGEPEPITPAPTTDRGLRYADLAVDPAGEWLYCVREDHDAAADGDAEEPVASVVRVPVDGSAAPTVVAEGHDFYAAPRPSPDGDRLAWLTWDHPRMPWDGTELHVATVTDDGDLADERVVLGGADESVFQPAWGPDGRLHAVSDRTGWWNLYRRDDDGWTPLHETDAEYGSPQWVFGLATYAFLADGSVVAVATRDGEQRLELIAPDGSVSTPTVSATVFGHRGHPQLRSDGEAVYFVAGGPATPERLVRWTPVRGEEVLRESAEVTLDAAYVSTPEHVTVPTRDGSETHAFVYPPTNPDVRAPADERPPLVVFVHGGPTSRTAPSFDRSKQFFTSRGFAVADVNYRGSTGYGRAYREALKGEWGERDVTDCIDVARWLADAGRVDGDRLAIRGGSAGGFVVLAALAFHDDFAAGASYYGVADLERLAELTHKFESRYLDGLVGPYPEAADTYDARSPVNHADDITAPVLLLQGAEDAVVPLSQAEAMADSLAARGVPHELVVFEGEQHGFRGADARRRAHERELAFYGAALGFEPADDLPTVDLGSDTER